MCHHDLLIERLKEEGLFDRLVPLIHVYLHNRMRFVECNGSRSDNLHVFSGVPQGTPEPLLFLIYLITLPQKLMKVFPSNCLRTLPVRHCCITIFVALRADFVRTAEYKN